MVRVLTTTKELVETRQSLSQKVGFVPTMGNLHQGHLSLLERAFTDCGCVIFSIFVNPKQFGPSEDFNRYPRTLENDISLIQSVAQRFSNKDVFVYAPKDPSEVYQDKLDQTISVPGVSEMLEGAIRPGHFDGVATVVLKLFELVKPTVAYFGLKDFQQYLVIKTMVKDLALPIHLVGMPIIREESGLALSSRNQYLSEGEKKEALILSQTLNELRSLLQNKRSNLSKAQDLVTDKIKDPRWNYLEIRDAETLSTDITHSKTLSILGVYQLGTTRLLDNLQVELQ